MNENKLWSAVKKLLRTLTSAKPTECYMTSRKKELFANKIVAKNFEQLNIQA
jgi:hypothetical protein